MRIADSLDKVIEEQGNLGGKLYYCLRSIGVELQKMNTPPKERVIFRFKLFGKTYKLTSWEKSHSQN